MTKAMHRIKKTHHRADARRQGKKVVYYTSADPAERTNAATLVYAMHFYFIFFLKRKTLSLSLSFSLSERILLSFILFVT